MNKILLLLALMATNALAQAQNCTIYDCQPPYKEKCLDWCIGMFLTEGSSEEIRALVGSKETTDKILEARENKGVLTANDVQKIISKEEYALLKERLKSIEENYKKMEMQRFAMTGFAKSQEYLLAYVKQQQERYVKKSCGKESEQNFTEEDLLNFIQQNRISDIRIHLSQSEWLMEIVKSLRSMSPMELETLLNKALTTRRPTWSEQNAINCSGQTEAGAKAEQMIAEAIVDIVKTELAIKK